MTATDISSIELDQYYPHPRGTVWRALTTPTLMSRWLMTPDGFEPRPGTEFTFTARPMPNTGFSGQIACRVLQAIQPSFLSYTWDDATAGHPTGWIISWRLHEEGHGTRLVLTHTGFDPDAPTAQLARSIMNNGWTRMLDTLDTILTETR